MRFLVLLAALWLAPHAAFASVGVQRVEIVDPVAGPIEVGIWYPTAARAAPSRLELFEQHVAPPGAAVLGASLPLIVISHSHRGSLAAHYDTAIALAEAGFVAAALTHPRYNWRDASGATAVWERPRHLKALTDYMLERWPDHARLAPFVTGGQERCVRPPSQSERPVADMLAIIEPANCAMGGLTPPM